MFYTGFKHDYESLPEWIKDAYDNYVISNITDDSLYVDTIHGLVSANEEDHLIYEEETIRVQKTEIFLKNYDERRKEMDFGEAIKLLKEGKRLKRAGWNGKNQYIELAERIAYINSKGEIINEGHANIGNKVIAFVGTSGVQLGWLASQADMLAEDWAVVEEE